MVEPSARIRSYQPDDHKLARFFIGRANFEVLAVANRKVYTSPLFLAAWVAVSCIFIQIMKWWPNSNQAWWTYLKPLPAFAATSVPLMFLVDWNNRPSFEAQVQQVLRRQDILDIRSYYSRSPASGFWILEFGDKFVGFIAVDASLDATSEDTVISSATQGSKASRKEVVSTKAGTSSIATIRHFYVKEEYRPALSQDDLLHHAIQHAFNSDKAVGEIRVTDLELASWASQAFRKQGFIIDKQVAKVGVLGWSIRERVLTRERWKKIQDAN